MKKGFTLSEGIKDACHMRHSRFAFTLAEVLITLGIIGIVAALTMPSLIAKHQEKQTVTAVKKFYSSISQAYLMAKNENGIPVNWYDEGNNSYQNAYAIGKNITKYMKVIKDCDKSERCFGDYYTKLDGKIPSSFPGGVVDSLWDVKTYILNDGMSVNFYSYGTVPKDLGEGFLKESYGSLGVDINGKKGPNVWGRDSFTFIITKEGIVPVGTQSYKKYSGFPEACNKTDCLDNCEGCTAWVIYNENMDYLHCDDLSWEGKTECK